MTTLKELISELEAATDGASDLDRKIMIADGWTPEEKPTVRGMWSAPRGRRFLHAGHVITGASNEYPYTRSLDAARALVPDGWQWGIITYPENELFNPGAAQAYCMKLARVAERVLDGHAHAEGRTAELALCIAALKARHNILIASAPEAAS